MEKKGRCAKRRMPRNEEYQRIDAFFGHLLAHDPLAAAVAYYGMTSHRRSTLWNPIVDADLPPWVERDIVLAHMDARERGDDIARYRTYKSASPTTRPVLDRLGSALR